MNKLAIWLHGYGANGKDFENIDLNVTTISPNAPFVCEEFESGFQWFSLKDRSFESIRNGLNSVRPFVFEYIKKEAKNHDVSLSNCFILGFSQGAMVALDMIYAFEELGGIVAFSGGFFKSEDKILINKQTKVALIHGTNDEVLPYKYFKNANNSLLELGFNPKTLSLSIAHYISNEGIEFAKKIIEGI